MGDDEEEPEDTKAVEDAEAVGHARIDGLRQELKRRQQEASQLVNSYCNDLNEIKLRFRLTCLFFIH